MYNFKCSSTPFPFELLTNPSHGIPCTHSKPQIVAMLPSASPHHTSNNTTPSLHIRWRHQLAPASTHRQLAHEVSLCKGCRGHQPLSSQAYPSMHTPCIRTKPHTYTHPQPHTPGKVSHSASSMRCLCTQSDLVYPLQGYLKRRQKGLDRGTNRTCLSTNSDGLKHRDCSKPKSKGSNTSLLGATLQSPACCTPCTAHHHQLECCNHHHLPHYTAAGTARLPSIQPH
ncbi:hypothetical protein COO60DRAFT_502305 [Scenedesmus sp. NREL 46B-D3]|nr:hypothetical protein COO60DRAFT_502305 [Scenedesmus sp. NREL 46B-D3]